MLQVVIAGAHLPPREINWGLELVLMGLVLALSLTGYLLPWDQKGYWATQVATNIAGNLPGVGSAAQKVIVGGPEYGHHTLSRFYALHVGILPPLLIFFLILHVAIFRRHGLTTRKDAEGEGWFWPDQAFRDMLVALAILGVMLGLVVYGHGNAIDPPAGESAAERSLYEKMAHAGRDGMGANLDAPADPGTATYPARPEWYFLFLFQLLKYFEGDMELLGTVVIPNGAMLLLAVLPLLGYGRMRTLGHALGVLVVTGLLAGAAVLTCLALAEDTPDQVAREVILLVGLRLVPFSAALLVLWIGVMELLPRGAARPIVGILGGLILLALGGLSGFLVLAAQGGEKSLPGPVVAFVKARMTEEEKKESDKAKKFHEDAEEATRLARRAVNLAHAGIPPEGAINLLRRDPLTQGPALFGQQCVGCHSYKGVREEGDFKAGDLNGFGTEEWIYRLLANPGHDDFFGRIGRTTMQEWVETNMPNVGITPEAEANLGPEDRKLLEQDRKDLRTLARWLSRHPRPDMPDKEEPWFKEGAEIFMNRDCASCHKFGGEGGTRGPDLTGYGDADWLRLMIMKPYHKSRYGDTNTMPGFRDLDGPTAPITLQELEDSKQAALAAVTGMTTRDERRKEAIKEGHTLQHLSDVDRELLIRWLLKDYRVIFGGDPISAPPPR
jgi:quinol-cytochrome oxidoreductase complex cytochrome b subunit/mono/diheme cytochrome c family protein